MFAVRGTSSHDEFSMRHRNVVHAKWRTLWTARASSIAPDRTLVAWYTADESGAIQTDKWQHADQTFLEGGQRGTGTERFHNVRRSVILGCRICTRTHGVVHVAVSRVFATPSQAPWERQKTKNWQRHAMVRR